MLEYRLRAAFSSGQETHCTREGVEEVNKDITRTVGLRKNGKSMFFEQRSGASIEM